ncbi:MAG TPA: DUF4252 domain-containing protein [Flavobacteriaceae bacterium]|jgi:hypothetical protein|nr:DUF4252 domain-containing protein [Flavobacteriaceae bacterium]
MKKLTVIFGIAILMMPFLSQAQVFDKYTDMKNVTSMLVTSEMFKLLTEIDYDSTDPETQAYADLIESLNNIQVYSTSDAKIGSKMAMDIQNYLKTNSMKKLMSFKEDGKSVEFYSKPGKSDSYVSELLMFMNGMEDGEAEAVIMRITGNVDLKQISKLAKDLKVPGAKELENINEK